jgi:hypothetical protein
MLFSTSGCNFSSQKNADCFIVESESWFDDFTVRDDKVYIKCEVVLQNTTSDKQRFKMAAICSEDVDTGLLKNEKVYAVDDHEKERVFEIHANSKQTFEDVVFLGKYGGNNKKSNRLLPRIILESI